MNKSVCIERINMAALGNLIFFPSTATPLTSLSLSLSSPPPPIVFIVSKSKGGHSELGGKDLSLNLNFHRVVSGNACLFYFVVCGMKWYSYLAPPSRVYCQPQSKWPVDNVVWDECLSAAFFFFLLYVEDSRSLFPLSVKMRYSRVSEAARVSPHPLQLVSVVWLGRELAGGVRIGR